MIDIRALRDDLDAVKAALARRGVEPSEVDAVFEADVAWRAKVKNVDDLRAEQGGYRIYTSAEAAELASSGQVLALEPLCGGLPPERAWHYLRAAAAAVAPR